MTASDWRNVCRCIHQREIVARFYDERDVERREMFAGRKLERLYIRLAQLEARSREFAGETVPVY